MKHYSDTILKQGTGLALSGASVTVCFAGTLNKAVLYSANDVGSARLPNPVQTNSKGLFSFYVANGSYDLIVSDGGLSTVYPDIEIYDLDEPIAPLGSIERSGLALITPFQFMTAAQRAARIPGVTDDLPFFNAAIDYWRANSVNHDTVNRGAGRIHVPAGTYFISDAIDNKGVAIRWVGDGHGKAGGYNTLIYVAAGKTGARVQRHNTIGAGQPAPSTQGADGTVYEGLAFRSLGGVRGTGVYGLRARARFVVRDCHFLGFADDGINIIAAAGGGAFEGNANCFLIENSSFYDNGFSGIQIAGADANAGIIRGCDLAGRQRYGILDRSLLGNLIIGNHTAGNGLTDGTGGSSVVGYNGVRYYVRPGQALAARTTQPGTNAAVWGLHVSQGGETDPTIHPTWYSGIPVFEGAPFAATDANSRTCFVGNYAEGGQPPCVMAQRTTAFGNFWDEIGVTGYDQPACYTTSHFGAFSSQGGFYSDNGIYRVSFNRGGSVSEVVHGSSFPFGLRQAVFEHSLVQLYGADNQIMRLYGPFTGHPLGFGTYRYNYGIAVGDDNTYVKMQVTEGHPGALGAPHGTRMLVRGLSVGGVDKYLRIDGAWYGSGIVGGVQAAAVADLAGGATLADVVAKINAMLATDRASRQRAS